MALVIFLVLMFLFGNATGQKQDKPEDMMMKEFQDQVKAFGNVWKAFASESLGAKFLQVIHIAYFLLFI